MYVIEREFDNSGGAQLKNLPVYDKCLNCSSILVYITRICQIGCFEVNSESEKLEKSRGPSSKPLQNVLQIIFLKLIQLKLLFGNELGSEMSV